MLKRENELREALVGMKNKGDWVDQFNCRQDAVDIIKEQVHMLGQEKVELIVSEIDRMYDNAQLKGGK